MEKNSLEQFTSLSLSEQLKYLLQIFQDIEKHNTHSRTLLQKMKQEPLYFTKSIMKDIYKECLSIHGERGMRLQKQKIQHIKKIGENEKKEQEEERRNLDTLLNF